MLGELPLLRMLPPHSRRHHDSWTPINTELRARASLAAGLAYHEWRQGGANDYEAREAAVAASQTVLPLPWQEASLRTPSPTRPTIIPSGFGGAPNTLKSGVQTSGTI